ncbi:MAG: SH3 domain-containing protein [Pseudomonadota bacterium]
MRRAFNWIIRAATFFAVAIAVASSPGDAPATTEKATVGPETNLPLPRYVSLKSNKANIRRGPGLTHRIDWVFLRKGMPLEVVAEHGHWRKVRDVDHATGWVHHALLRGRRSAVVIVDQAVLRGKPEPDAKQVAHAEPGVIFTVERCAAAWCEVRRDRFEGWVRKAEIWGVGREEIFD